MKPSERNGHAWLRENVLAPGDRLDRVENLLLAGMFDSNYCIDGREGWLELKAPNEPKRCTTPLFGTGHKFSQDQKNWALRQLRSGGTCWLYINTDVRRILLRGELVDRVNKMPLQEILEEATWIHMKGEPLIEATEALRNILRGSP